MLSAKLCGLIMGVTATVRDAQRLIQELVEAQAVAYNVSYSAAAMLHDGSVMAAAAGFDDHATGSKVTIESMYPSGSVTKTFTAVGIMRLAQQGKLDLDATAASLIDPWMKAHGRLSLKMQWDGDDTMRLSQFANSSRCALASPTMMTAHLHGRSSTRRRIIRPSST